MDRIIRVIIATLVGISFYSGLISGTFGIILLVIAGILLLTSIIGFCPLYKLFGLQTCPTTEKK